MAECENGYCPYSATCVACSRVEQLENELAEIKVELERQRIAVKVWRTVADLHLKEIKELRW
jgi:hypothetical protein